MAILFALFWGFILTYASRKAGEVILGPENTMGIALCMVIGCMVAVFTVGYAIDLLGLSS